MYKEKNPNPISFMVSEVFELTYGKEGSQMLNSKQNYIELYDKFKKHTSVLFLRVLH
jgi:hypothetical protein